MKPKKWKRIVLGVGYPLYSVRLPLYTAIALTEGRDGEGAKAQFNIRNSGPWKKYRLILEEV